MQTLPATKPAINPLSANFTKWSNTLKQFVGNLPTNCLRVFGHFVGLALKGLTKVQVNNSNTRTRCEICSKLTRKTPERRHWHRSGVFRLSRHNFMRERVHQELLTEYFVILAFLKSNRDLSAFGSYSVKFNGEQMLLFFCKSLCLSIF